MKRYDFKKIEAKWQKIWLSKKTYEPNLKNAKKPFYNLMMFPYPSAEGLHVGNMYAFVGSDSYGRYKRMQGNDVFQPIGLDGFGIHSENYALKIGVHPAKQARISEKRFYKQLKSIGNGFAWDEKLETYDPEYYRWTQWIFIQMFNAGLAYRKKAAVNWCPKDLTVLADEQVINGKCERCGAEVQKKELEQWFFKITDYVEQLLNNLGKIDWSEKVKIAQRNWIGKSEGALLKFQVSSSELKVGEIEVFTTRPDTLFGATFVVISPAHPLLKSKELGIKNYEEVQKYIKQTENVGLMYKTGAGEKTGVELRGVKAINPATRGEIPVWVAGYVSADYGAGAIMAVPAHDERDMEFAKKYKLPIKQVIAEGPPWKMSSEDFAYAGKVGLLVNSGEFDGMDSEEAKWKITDFVKGERKIQYRLRDWLISRQRYWGAPIPMIHCNKCGWQPEKEENLPILLPRVKDFRPQGKGESPLASVKEFYKTKCPKCGGEARRETDVSDTFLDSAWYYLGYLMKSGNWKLEIGNSSFQKILKRWLPVNMYIGGAEHSVLHLLYSRFIAMAFHDQGLLSFDEPFTRFRAHGLLIKEGAKMSKSKGNVVNPDEYVKRFGADALRMYLMFVAPFEQGGDFRDTGILGVVRFLERVWKLTNNLQPTINKQENAIEIKKSIHRTIKKVTEDIENLHYNTAISALMILLNDLEKNQKSLVINHLLLFLKLIAPFAPHITEELWHELGEKGSIHLSAWPEFDPQLIKEEEFDLVVQINGKHRDTVRVRMGISQKEAEALVLQAPRIKELLIGKPIKKTIFVPNRLINFVV